MYDVWKYPFLSAAMVDDVMYAHVPVMTVNELKLTKVKQPNEVQCKCVFRALQEDVSEE